jgi:hypothetical protein
MVSTSGEAIIAVTVMSASVPTPVELIQPGERQKTGQLQKFFPTTKKVLRPRQLVRQSGFRETLGYPFDILLPEG